MNSLNLVKRLRGRPSNTRRIEEKTIQEVGYSELRTTEAKIQEYPPFRDGCPQCGENPVVTMSRLFNLNGTREIRICRCRVCPWHGKLKR